MRYRTAQRVAFRTLLAGAAIALVLAVGGCGGSGASDAELEALSGQAQNFAERLAKSLAPYRVALREIAANPEVIAAVSDANAAALAGLGEQLVPDLEYVMQLRLFPDGDLQVDDSASPPVTFATIAMMRRAREENGVDAELHRNGQPDEHVALVEPITRPAPSAGEEPAVEVLGFAHLSLRSTVITRELSLSPPDGFFVSLQQSPDRGAPFVIAKAGSAPEEVGLEASTKVTGTRFDVVLKPESGGSGGGGPTVWVAGLGVLIALLFGGGLALRMRGSGVTIASESPETVVYQGAILAIMDGAHPGLESLVPGLGGRASANEDTTDVSPVTDEVDQEDATTFAAAPNQGNDDPTVPSSAEATTEEPEVPETTAAEDNDPQPRLGEDDLLEPPGDMAAGESGDDAPPQLDGAEADGELDFDLDLPELSLDEDTAADLDVGGAIDTSIFRSYDIRGIVGETLTPEGVYKIGRALGAEAAARDQSTVVVARDGRGSSPSLSERLIAGLTESGRDVIDIGLAPTPVLYFATHYLDARSGVMLTGSHNPANYNGLKIVLDGETLSGEAIQAIKARIDGEDFVEGSGAVQKTEILPDYIRRISEEIPVTLGDPLKIVVDCGNGVPGVVAPDLLRAIGHDVVELYCEVDGDFPNHHPDPSQPDNLVDLINTVASEGADLGLAFDGDGDRLGVVDGAGNVIWPDRQMMLFSKDIIGRNPGAKIIFDVKCTRLLADEIQAAGGEPLLWKTGHSLIKAKMQETGALLAGEMSGHIFFKERWYGFDDAIYAAARLVEIIVNAGASAEELFAALPDGVATPELRIDMAEEQHQPFMTQVLEVANFEDGKITTVDGLRVDFPDSWGLIRPSNTTPCLVLRFEGDNDAALDSVKERFRDLLLGIDGSLSLPF
ncbi:MAG: phosphomannomutase/phosphoglucomutase [Pseudomonadota bacterium]